MNTSGVKIKFVKKITKLNNRRFFGITSMKININNLKKKPHSLASTAKVDSLFGWSMVHFNDELFVGAPKIGKIVYSLSKYISIH